MSKKDQSNQPPLFEEKMEFQSLDYIMSDRFARYSKYIIQQRALPDIRDGLKPVQRRILYSMHDLNLQHDKPYKKSARVVGDVIGKYHPHGDSSIYEALVRMAQDWKMNMPLVEMHGNKGSIDDDPAAAMRYTEVRLEKITSLLLSELNKNTVNFAPNFDDTEKEPVVLPAYIPNLLLNGSRGIASGFATEIPPHNLGELLDAVIAKIKNPELSWQQMMKYIKGPDFPTGGIVYGLKGLEQAFERGQGRIAISSKYEIVEENKTKIIRISEIPFGVIKAKLVRQIDELRLNGNISDIKEVRDESDRHGISIAIIIEAKANAEAILNFLLQKTDMKIYYTYNMISIVDNAPKVFGIERMLSSYLTYAKEVKTRSAQFDLAKFKKRLEIIKGFIRVSEIPDQVIKVIREASGGKQAVINDLVNILKFSLIQATAIAELRLYRLNRTDVGIYHKEKGELEEKIAYLELILSDVNAFDQHLIEIFKTIKKEYAIPRRTEIIANELNITIKQDELISAENCWISLTKSGYLKRFSNQVYQANDPDTFGIKEDDHLLYLNQSNTVNKLLIFTSEGNYALVGVHKINESKWKEHGQHISDFVDIGTNDQVIGCLDVANFDTKAFVILITKFGIGKKVALEEFAASRTSKMLKAMTFKKKNDQLIGAKVSNGLEDLIIITNTNHIVKFSENNVPLISARASGSALIKVEHNWVTAFGLANSDDKIILINNNNYKILKMSLISPSTKATKGIQIFKNLSAKNAITDIIKNQNFRLIHNKNQGGFQIIDSLKDDNEEFINETFNKFSRNNGIIANATNYNISPDNKYFDVKVSLTKEVRDEKITQQEIKINRIFESQKDKIDAIDEKKLDDILKKLKL